jgi:peptidoglycan hydrolase-like protein with peptidoglycan-binding domain
MVSLEVQKTLVRSKVETLVTTKHLPKKTLTKGERGKDVLLLQKSLVTLGYLPSKDVTGLFGDRTYTALKNYQLQQKIISSDGGHGTGVVGTATRSALKKSLTENLLKKVRAAEMGV